METTVRKIAASRLFQQIPCVAGEAGLDNRVDYVTICNSPILNLPQYNLNDYVFVITSFSPYYDSIENMKAMIRVLDEPNILKGAYTFYFQDEDGPKNKIWRYIKAMRK